MTPLAWVVAWVVLSVPVCVLVGRWLKSRDYAEPVRRYCSSSKPVAELSPPPRGPAPGGAGQQTRLAEAEATIAAARRQGAVAALRRAAQTVGAGLDTGSEPMDFYRRHGVDIWLYGLAEQEARRLG